MELGKCIDLIVAEKMDLCTLGMPLDPIAAEKMSLCTLGAVFDEGELHNSWDYVHSFAYKCTQTEISCITPVEGVYTN